MTKSKKLVVVGDSAFAEIGYEYFTYDSPYQVVAFSVESAHIKQSELFQLPVVPFEDLESSFSPRECEVYVAVAYSQLNRLRARLAAHAKDRGFRLASYVSSRSFLWRNVKLGEHCFVFEDNTVQPFVAIGDNVVLWSGNHIGHHSRIGDNCFISSQVAISGFCTIGENCFFGVNSAVANNVVVGRDCWVGAGVTITKDVGDNLIFGNPDARASRISARRFCRIRE